MLEVDDDEVSTLDGEAEASELLSDDEDEPNMSD